VNPNFLAFRFRILPARGRRCNDWSTLKHQGKHHESPIQQLNVKRLVFLGFERELPVQPQLGLLLIQLELQRQLGLQPQLALIILKFECELAF
jgi:hypothetical protein